MIRAVMVMNTLGKLRLARFYDFQPAQNQQQIVRSVYSVLCRRPENVSSFIQVESIFGPDTRLVYKHYATLYVVFVFDSSENELAMLDLIQVFVETLDKSFKNVCELDIVFSYNKQHGKFNNLSRRIHTKTIVDISSMTSLTLHTGWNFD
ncbi:AP-3 complex subunit sigma-like isoform X3 [Diospyros lotus]|uniref:AP-3 complex subunit sigma-like isoform X3 n=1 Tax=Diospyros lotus TaxID=55363 RepID=UPI0022594A10|nr:AP-3 complex subunit sigma-like isoform X3 [Diospyros lotus]